MSRPSLTRNVTSNWVGMGLGVIYALIITPIVVRTLDKELYGIWTVLDGLLTYSELFYLGLGSAVIRYVAKANAEHDITGVNRLASVVFSIYTAIGIVCFLILSGLSFRVGWFFEDPLPPDVSRMASITLVLLGVRMILVFVGSAFSGVMAGHDRFDLVNGVAMAASIVRFVAIPLLLKPGGEPLLFLAILVCVTSLIETAALAAIAFAYVPGLAIRLVKPRLPELKALYGFGVPSFFVLIAFKLINFTDNLVIGKQLGAVAVTFYSIPFLLIERSRMAVGGFTGVLLPRLTALVAQGDTAGLREAYLRSARMGCFIAGVVSGLLMTLGPPFLGVWMGPEFVEPARPVLFWLGIAAFAQAFSTQVPYPFYQALHMVAFPAAVLTVEAISNLVLSLILARPMGITGVALATAVPSVLITMAILPASLCRRLGLPLGTLVARSGVPGLVMFGAALGLQYLLDRAIPAQSYATLALRGVITLPVIWLVFQTTFPADERAALVGRFRRHQEN